MLITHYLMKIRELNVLIQYITGRKFALAQ